MCHQDADQTSVEVDDAVLAAARLDRPERGAGVYLPAVSAWRLVCTHVQDLLA
jgi:hypothetical protein